MCFHMSDLLIISCILTTGCGDNFSLCVLYSMSKYVHLYFVIVFYVNSLFLMSVSMSVI